MERKIPDFNKNICSPLFGFRNRTATPEDYVKKIQELERKFEKDLIDLLKKMDVYGSVKTIPYSLPYKEEFLVTLKGESYINGPYESKRVFNPIIKELLSKNINKFRFYFQIDVITEKQEHPPDKLYLDLGRIEYRFRYYPS